MIAKACVVILVTVAAAYVRANRGARWRGRPIDMIAADGRYLGTVSGIALPSAASASGQGAWIERDEMDVEKVVVRKLPAVVVNGVKGGTKTTAPIYVGPILDTTALEHVRIDP